MIVLKIAYLNFEFLPHTAIGGIATYTEQIVKLMAARRHLIELFTSVLQKEKANRFDKNIFKVFFFNMFNCNFLCTR